MKFHERFFFKNFSNSIQKSQICFLESHNANIIDDYQNDRFDQNNSWFITNQNDSCMTEITDTFGSVNGHFGQGSF